jgi:signal transduction histidine kinase
LRASRTRGNVARLVVELAASPSPGQLEEALARALGDPGLRLVFPATDGRYIDADGRVATPSPDTTALVRDGREVAVLTHRAGLFDEPGLVDEVAAIARLALEHERLRAELLFQLANLRASRARIVTTGDAERRRLERDLHDGAQQRLVALALDLQVARIRLGADGETARSLIDRVQRAERQVENVLAELRTLASGIYPAVLAHDGLAAALEALAEDARGQLRISALTDRRFDLATESAAYRVVSQTIAGAGGASVSVSAAADDRRLVLELVSPRPPAELTELEDRIGAIDGTLSVSSTDSADARIRVEIPCAS